MQAEKVLLLDKDDENWFFTMVGKGKLSKTQMPLV
jgi:hypothetical protein